MLEGAPKAKVLPFRSEIDFAGLSIGTMNLLVSLLYLLAVLAVMAGPWHALAIGRPPDTGGPPLWAMLPRAAAGLALGAVAVVVPLRRGVRALREMEF